MCLQWCHVQRWLINNDMACVGCARGAAAELPTTWSCASCEHMRPRAGAPPICGLTCAPVPVSWRCCHWQAELAEVPADSIACAPWLGYQASGLSQGQLRLDDLSVPLVYGVPAGEWALLDALDDAERSAAPLDMVRRAAIELALELCDSDPGQLGLALGALDAALLPGGDTSLPPGWRAIVLELRQIAAERASMP